MPDEPTIQRPETADRPAPSDTGDDVLKALSGLESGLEGLRARLAEAQRAEQIILQQRRQLDLDRAQLKQQQQDTANELAAAKAAIERDRGAVEALSRAVEEREAQAAKELAIAQERVAQAEAKVREAIERAEVAAREADRAAAEADEARGAAGSAAEELRNWRERAERAELAAARALADLEQARGEARAAAGEMASLRAAHAQATERLAGVERELAAIKEQSASLTQACRAAEQSAQARQQELDKLRVQFKRRESEADALQLELTEVRRALAERIDEVELLREELRASGDGARQSADRAAFAQHQVEERDRELDAARQEARALTERAAAMESRITELTDRASALERQLVADDARAAVLQEQLGESERAVRDHEQVIASLRDDLSRQALAFEQDRATRGTSEDELHRAADSARHEATAAAARADRAAHELTALHARLEELQAERDRLEKSLAEAVARAHAVGNAAGGDDAELRGRLEELNATLETREAAIEKLYEQLRSTQSALEQVRQERDSARRQIASGGGGGMGGADPLARERRERLKRARALVRDQSKKVRVASDALRTRFEQCEILLAQREELAEAKRILNDAQRQFQRRRAGGRVAAMLCYGLLSVAILAGLSLGVAREVIPGTFSARAVLVADGAGRTLSADERAEWTRFHLDLMDDPQTMGEAAERLGRRGIAALSNPGVLQEWLATRLTAESPEPGTINVELIADGAERTERILETITTTISSRANATRQRRVDGAATKIAQAPEAGSSPIDHQRLVWAGGFTAGGLVFMLAGGGLLWRRLAHARERFEGESKVDNALDDAKWTTFKAG